MKEAGGRGDSLGRDSLGRTMRSVILGSGGLVAAGTGQTILLSHWKVRHPLPSLPDWSSP